MATPEELVAERTEDRPARPTVKTEHRGSLDDPFQAMLRRYREDPERANLLARLRMYSNMGLTEALAHLQAGYRAGYRDGKSGAPYGREAGGYDLSYWHGYIEGAAARPKKGLR